jgi:hypothetical protein
MSETTPVTQSKESAKNQRIAALLADYSAEDIAVAAAEHQMRNFRASEAAKAPPLPAEMTPEQWAMLKAYMLDGAGHMDGHRAICEMLAALNDGNQADFWLGLLIHGKVGLCLDPAFKKEQK